MKALSDFMDADEIRGLSSFVPNTREEYIKFSQLSYNLKLNTEVPMTVHIEPTNKCNQTCVMCVHPDMQRTVGFVEDDIAYKAIDECAEFGVYAVHFFFFGEPFMNRKTIDYIAYAKRKNIPVVSVTTNLTTIKRSEIERMVTDGLNSVHISFEGLNREKYAAIRGTDSFDKVIRNLDYLRECKAKHGRDNPWISMTYVRTSETDEEIETFKNLWKDRVNNFHISPQFDYIGRAKIRETQGDVNSEGIMKRSDADRLPCRQLWQRLVVLSNGELVPCSQNIDGELSVGNIRDMTIAEAWQGDKMAQLRGEHLTNRIPKDCVCSDCIDWDWSGKVDSRKKLGRSSIENILKDADD
ncbi:radical SAM protein [Kordiimonas laminariae]|uniref:radical SAM protein n=1 Tax=Kordiimonas laminariae TaxID=2917717 RepID=UPI001FF430F3|nr:radical SAM/SPASM domain-containing protein [Kordiimonas laminariae]MCK0070486.1 radical SAM protein [Kordiimonas laminariae]